MITIITIIFNEYYIRKAESDLSNLSIFSKFSAKIQLLYNITKYLILFSFAKMEKFFVLLLPHLSLSPWIK